MSKEYTNAPWRDESVLRQKYIVEEKSTYEMADELGCGATTVNRWLEKHDIDKEDPGWPNETHPWQDESVLRELYWDRGMDQKEIADRLGCHPVTVSDWFQRLGIQTRIRLPGVTTRKDGYEIVQNQHKGDTFRVRVHRLAAVAWGLLDAKDLCNQEIDIHHKSNIPWDNRECNLEAIPHGEHRSKHGSGELDHFNSSSI